MMAKRILYRWCTLPLMAAVLIALVGLTACGGGGSSHAVASTLPMQVNIPGNAVASVDGTPITKATYNHWLGVAAASGAPRGGSKPTYKSLQSVVLGFLISSQWVIGEASSLGVKLSDAEVKKEAAKIWKTRFSNASEFEKYLASSGYTVSDLLLKLKVSLLSTKIRRHVEKSVSVAQAQATYAKFVKAFEQKWKAKTDCRVGYVVEDCNQYKTQYKAPKASSTTAAAKTPASNAKPSAEPSKTPAEEPAHDSSATSAAVMSLASSAFPGEDHPLPAKYMCAGAVSPPLQWKGVPANAAALVLVVTSLDNSGSPVRWLVGDINPSAKGVAEGQTPEGGIVGSNAEGHAGYSGICPRKGGAASITLTLFALSKKIPLSTGFHLAQAAHDLYAGKLLLSSAVASTYTP